LGHFARLGKYRQGESWFDSNHFEDWRQTEYSSQGRCDCKNNCSASNKRSNGGGDRAGL